MDFATRAYNHSFPFDPIVRSLLDTDFYKLLMQQFIWEHYPNERVDWALTNRTRSVRLAEELDLAELRQQLDHVRELRFTNSEIIHLRGQTFYGQSGIFKEGYLHALKSFQLPDYALGDPDLEAEGTEDSFEDHRARFGYTGPGCSIADTGEDDDPLEANGDERDSNNAEDEVLYAGYGGGPGCPISDPDCAVDDGPCDGYTEDGI